MLNNIPFDETIFVESDCLAYADLNPYFDVMSSGGNSDFTVFGTNYSLTHQFSKNEWGWFDPKQLGKYESKVSFIPRFGSTLIYMKKGRYCSDMFNICVDVMNRPTEYGFSAEVLDDQIFAVGMAVMGYKCIDGGREWDCCVYPFHKQNKWKPEPQMHMKNLSYIRPDYGKVNGVKLCHWGNYLTTKALYKREVKVLNAYVNHDENKIKGIVFVYKVLIPISNVEMQIEKKVKEIYGRILNNRKLRKKLYPVEFFIKKTIKKK